MHTDIVDDTHGERTALPVTSSSSTCICTVDAPSTLGSVVVSPSVIGVRVDGVVLGSGGVLHRLILG